MDLSALCIREERREISERDTGEMTNEQYHFLINIFCGPFLKSFLSFLFLFQHFVIDRLLCNDRALRWDSGL